MFIDLKSKNVDITINSKMIIAASRRRNGGVDIKLAVRNSVGFEIIEIDETYEAVAEKLGQCVRPSARANSQQHELAPK